MFKIEHISMLNDPYIHDHFASAVSYYGHQTATKDLNVLEIEGEFNQIFF